jgi:hypothetical protein
MSPIGGHMRVNKTKKQQNENNNAILEIYYSKTRIRREDGVYVVRYPIKINHMLGSSLPWARARF